MLTELENAGLSHVGGHELGQIRPSGDELEPPARIGLDPRRGGQRDGDARAGGAHGPQRSRAGVAGECLDAGRVVSV